MGRMFLHHAIAAAWPLVAGVTLVAWSWARAAAMRQGEPDREGARAPAPERQPN